MAELTINDKTFFGEDTYNKAVINDRYGSFDAQYYNDSNVGNLLHAAENCGLKVDISQEMSHNTDYEFPHRYGEFGTTVNIGVSGRIEDISRFNCCVDGNAPNEIDQLRSEISELKSKINNSIELDCKFKKLLDHTIANIQNKLLKEIDEDIFYSEIWQKALNIVNEEIKSLEF